MFHKLDKITAKPELYAFYTAEALWNDPYISKQMLKAHLNPLLDSASRNHAFIEASAAFMQSRFDLGKGKSVIDFGCGPGLYTTRFAQMGCGVRGLDFSINSLDYARKEAQQADLEIEYLQQNYLDYQAAEKFDLAVMIYCDYCALSNGQRKRLLKIMQDSIKDDGYIFMDVCTEQMYERIEEVTTLQRIEKEGFWSARPHYVFHSTFKYDADRVSLDKYTIIEEEKTFEIYNWLKYFTPEELSRELEESGLEITEIYSDFGGTSQMEGSEAMAVITQKSI